MHIHAVLRRWVSGGRAVLASLVTFLAARVRASRRRLGGFVAAATLATRHRQLVRYAPLLLAPVLAAAAVIPLMPGTPRQARPAGPPLGNLVQPPGLTRHAQQTTRGPVTLATGDVARLIPAPGGRSMVSVTPPRLTRNTAIHPFADTFKIGGDVYAVPGDALPYFGSVLDPRLFDCLLPPARRLRGTEDAAGLDLVAASRALRDPRSRVADRGETDHRLDQHVNGQRVRTGARPVSRSGPRRAQPGEQDLARPIARRAGPATPDRGAVDAGLLMQVGGVAVQTAAVGRVAEGAQVAGVSTAGCGSPEGCSRDMVAAGAAAVLVQVVGQPVNRASAAAGR